jgi:hypothetical protein
MQRKEERRDKSLERTIENISSNSKMKARVASLTPYIAEI